MKKILIIIFSLLFCLVSINSFSQNDNELLSFMVYGSDFITSIALPNTWTVDMSFAGQVGVNGFFYLKDYERNNSPAIIILSLAYKQNDGSELDEWVEGDLNGFLEYYEGFTIEELDWNIINENGYKIRVFCLKNERTGHLQYSAYFDVGLKYFANIYVTVIDKSKHNEIKTDFIKCLENSEFSGIGVKIQ